ncbi:MAG: double zinc ribbon domain-containing protein [Solirubrobacterales bacterium]
MPVAIFGITNNGLNLAVSLFVLMLVVVWLALIAYTFLDARRRISDPVLVACATAASLFPYIGTIVYVIVRPPEFIEDARERDLEMKASALRVRQLAELSCPNCQYPIEKNFLRCPHCQRRLKDPCPTCGKPVDPRWALCPYCEAALPGRARQQRAAAPQKGSSSQEAPRGERAQAADARAEPKAKQRGRRKVPPAPPDGDGADSSPERPKPSEPRPPSRRSKPQRASRQTPKGKR